MSFIKLLQGIGDRLGILESVTTAEPVPASRIQTRIVSLRELAGVIRSGEVRALADSPAELSISFNEIFAAAGISSKPEDWTVNRLKEIISAEGGEPKPRDAVQKAVLERLKSEGASTEVLVKDAIARDLALDAFENRVNERMRERTQDCQRRLIELDAQIKSLQEESARIEASLKSDEGKWGEWKRSKRAYERELASIASYVVDHPVVTMDEEG